MRTRSPALISIAASLLVACGTAPPPVGPPRDAGPRDAPAPLDGTPDPPDGSPDDGDAGDGGSALGSCRVAGEILTLATDPRAEAREVATGAGPVGFALAWSALAGGIENVWMAEMSSTEESVSVQQLTTGITVSRSPAVAPSDVGWLVAWTTNEIADFDVRARAWLGGAPVSDAQPLTARAGLDDDAQLLATTTGALATWIEARTGGAVAVSRAVGLDAIPSAAQVDSSPAGRSITRPRIARRSGGFSLAWVDSGSSVRDALLQPLDTSGAPAGAIVPLTGEGNADGTLDLAATESGGAAVIGVLVGGARPEVRGRALSATGTALGTEVPVVTTPETGRDASIARLAGGYVVAYRGLDTATPELRVAFLSDDLQIRFRTLVVGEIATTGGRLTIRVSGEGRMIVGWADVVGEETRIRAARIRCD
jgi:hypothetical protein